MNRNHQSGAALLVMTLILMLAAGLAIVFAANYSLLQQKTANNQQDSVVALAAAEAGLEYALAYLSANTSTITGAASSGIINYTFATVTQADGSTYSVVITNPTISDYSRLQITATGTSPDAQAQRIVKQEVYTSGSAIKYALTTQDNLIMSGNSSVTGPYGVDAGGAVIRSGSSSISNMLANDSIIASMTSTQFFTNFFGVSSSVKQANSTNYSSSSGVPWNNLSGSVWINSSVSLSGNNTIGSPTNPVILIVNGPLTLSGNTTVYGLIYATGTVSVSGSFSMTGGLVSEGNILTSGNAQINYDASILNQLSLAGGGSYAKLPGSWQDF